MAKPPYREHLAGAADLVTSYEQRRAGFVAMALERSRRAIPHIEQARVLKTVAERAGSPSRLLDLEGIWGHLVAAAGVSGKAGTHFSESDKREAVERLISKHLEPAGKNWVEELVFRFLLTRGDSLGGELRNVAGNLAQRRFCQRLIATMALFGISYEWQAAKIKQWISSEAVEPKPDDSVKAITWIHGKNRRTLIFNVKLPVVNKNVDISIVGCGGADLESAKKDPARYVAVGELKGGFDPAGADEHWKTARTALTRIRTEFAQYEHSPRLFYAGGAIEDYMAAELWSQLKAGSISYAANITNDDQLTGLCQWLIFI